jgi:hypothetical protein
VPKPWFFEISFSAIAGSLIRWRILAQTAPTGRRLEQVVEAYPAALQASSA